MTIVAPAGGLTAPSGGAAAALGPIDGPPAPVAPEVVNRNTHGNATVRATRPERPLQIDGRIDEEATE